MSLDAKDPNYVISYDGARITIRHLPTLLTASAPFVGVKNSLGYIAIARGVMFRVRNKVRMVAAELARQNAELPQED